MEVAGMVVHAAPTVRLAASSEAEAISSLVRRALAGYRDEFPVLHEGYLAYSLDPGHATGGDQLVAELDGTVVGSVLFHERVRGRPGWPGTASTFQTLAVDPSTRRRGIGARLVEACIDRARASGATDLIIETLPLMTAAEAFYGPFGFRRWPDGDWDGTPVLRRILGRAQVPETVLSAWRLPL